MSFANYGVDRVDVHHSLLLLQDILLRFCHHVYNVRRDGKCYTVESIKCLGMKLQRCSCVAKREALQKVMRTKVIKSGAPH